MVNWVVFWCWAGKRKRRKAPLKRTSKIGQRTGESRNQAEKGILGYTTCLFSKSRLKYRQELKMSNAIHTFLLKDVSFIQSVTGKNMKRVFCAFCCFSLFHFRVHKMLF